MGSFSTFWKVVKIASRFSSSTRSILLLFIMEGLPVFIILIAFVVFHRELSWWHVDELLVKLFAPGLNRAKKESGFQTFGILS